MVSCIQKQNSEEDCTQLMKMFHKPIIIFLTLEKAKKKRHNGNIFFMMFLSRYNYLDIISVIFWGGFQVATTLLMTIPRSFTQYCGTAWAHGWHRRIIKSLRSEYFIYLFKQQNYICLFLELTYKIFLIYFTS